MMLKLFTAPIALLVRLILFIMGWNLVPPDVFDRLLKHKRSVIVFSHTSYADFYMIILYILAYPKELKDIRTLVKPQPFRYAGWILRRFGAIPATRIDDKNQGSVNRIADELKQSERSIFLISPKGTIFNKPWRSGYYHIARELNCVLIAAGLDYEYKCVVVSEPIDNDKGEETIKTFLQNELTQIVPLHPEGEIVPIRSHKIRQLVDWNRVLIAGSVVLLIVVAYLT